MMTAAKALKASACGLHAKRDVVMKAEEASFARATAYARSRHVSRQALMTAEKASIAQATAYA